MLPLSFALTAAQQPKLKPEALRMRHGANTHHRSALLIRSAPTARSRGHRHVITGKTDLSLHYFLPAAKL